jgi:hypothetical protein
MTGEWWIDVNGEALFAEGDIGDYNHAMHAFEAALEISLEDPKAPEMIVFDPLSDEAITWLKEQGSSAEAIEYLKDGSDPRDYALEKLGWIRVHDGNFQVMNFDDNAKERIAEFIANELPDAEKSDEIITIEQNSDHELFTLPVNKIMHPDATADGLKWYVKRYGQFREERIITVLSDIYPRVVTEILAALTEEDTHGETNKEYEQRYELKELPDGLTDGSEIKQGLLFDKPGFSLRIRQEKTPKGNIEYTLTCKAFQRSDEAEVEITKTMYDKLWPETLPSKRMEKTRYKHNKWVIDDIKTPKDQAGIVAEIETDTPNSKITPPDEFDVVKKL